MTLQDNPLDFNDVPPTRKGRTSRRMSVARVAELVNDRIADLAVELLGTPNRALSSAQQLRFGTKGSIAVEIAGKDAGRWYDHEAGTGGAGPELIRHHFGMDEKAAWDWARNWLGDAEMPASWTAAKQAATKPAKAPTSGAGRTVELSEAELAAKVAEIVRQTEVPNGTPAHAYLVGRGIAVQPPDCIRYRRNAYGSHGAMVALATDAAGDVLAIQQVYLTAEGKKAPVNPVTWGDLPVRAVAVDTGGHHTKMAYEFCRTRLARRIWAIKGRGGPGIPVWPRRPTRTNKGKIPLFIVGVDAVKDAICARLKLTEPGPGAIHFPRRLDVDYFRQLTAERVVTRFERGRPIRSWQPKRDGERNEALDTFVYAHAALHGLISMGMRLNEAVGGLAAVANQPTNVRERVIRSPWMT